MRRGLRVASVGLILLLIGCGSSPSPARVSAGPSPVVAGSAIAGAAPTCPPIPPVAPPVTLGQPGWWRDRVFAEIFVRSYADSDGDGIGDLPGLTAKLDYLNDGDPTTVEDLGVTGLWLMPTFPSPSYHGYDVTDYRGVNPDYGTIDDLRALVAAAHRRGIAVILDLPLNHTSSRHPWFVASRAGKVPYADWYVWSDSPEGSNWQPDGKRFFYATFGPDMPDLNLENANVTAELMGDAHFWLTDVGVDGFRLDAAKHLIEDGATTDNTPETHAWWRTFRGAIEQESPGALLLGEVWDTPQNSSSYVPGDLDLTFDFALAGAMVSAAQSGDGDSVSRVLANVTTLYPASSGFAAFLTNHDQDRVASQLGSDIGALKTAAQLLLTGPGVPFIYYGEEIGMTGTKPDERIRTPMRWDASSPAFGFSTGEPWEALSDDPAPVNVADEDQDVFSLLWLYRNLIHYRALHPALSSGAWLPVTSDVPAVVASLRSSPTETALVLTNVSSAPVTPTLSVASGPFCGIPRVTSVSGAEESIKPPIVNAMGGFGGYRPVPLLDAHTGAVITFAR